MREEVASPSPVENGDTPPKKVGTDQPPQFLCPKIGLFISLRRFLSVCDRLHIIDVITPKNAIRIRLIHSFRVPGTYISCLQVCKEALIIDVSYKKMFFGCFFCFSFPFCKMAGAYYTYLPFTKPFFLVCFFSIPTFPFYPILFFLGY